MSVKFQSTLPVRGATRPGGAGGHGSVISIHAPREGSDLLGYSDERDHTISIHAPREGSDDGLYRLLEGLRIISIHAPREGSDSCLHFVLHPDNDFNPRSP